MRAERAVTRLGGIHYCKMWGWLATNVVGSKSQMDKVMEDKSIKDLKMQCYPAAGGRMPLNAEKGICFCLPSSLRHLDARGETEMLDLLLFLSNTRKMCPPSQKKMGVGRLDVAIHSLNQSE